MSEKVFSEVSPANLKRVAVVAVHGVGQHESGVTAQAVTDLLAGVESGGKTAQQNRYSSFGLRQVQISLAPSPRVNEEAMRNKLRLSSAIFEERRGVFRDLHTWNACLHWRG